MNEQCLLNTGNQKAIAAVRFALLLFVAVLTVQKTAHAEPDVTIYAGGDILTMDGDTPTYVEAVVQSGDRIAFVGSKSEALQRFANARQVDLKGKTLLPGMIDTHLHWGQFTMVSALDRVNPVEVQDVDVYIEHLREVAAATPEGQWIISYGYEKLLIPPYRNLTRADLDAASTKHPIYALYNNFHWATANSAALKTLNIDKSTPTKMAGGGVTFKDDNGEPTGLLTESAVYGIVPVAATLISPEDQALLPFKIANQMSANGLTTVADLSSGSENGVEEIRAIQAMANDDRFALRISATPMYDMLSQMDAPIPWDGKFQAVRCKLLMDASLAGGTSATVKKQVNGTTGNLNYTLEEFEAAIQVCLNKGFSVAAHVMGDRAHKVMLQAFENIAAKYDFDQFNNVIEHSALIDPSDLSRIKGLNMSVGFLSPFLHLYGDPLRDLVYGEEMAARMFAAAKYDALGINTTHHSDGPIVDSNPLYLVWSAVNRITSDNKTLGAQLQQDPYAALLGVTRNSAIHLGLEDEIGTLTAGKLADFVILAENPIKVDPMKIRDVEVLQTIKGGKVYFNKL